MIWEQLLSNEITKPYFVNLASSVKSSGTFYPSVSQMFSAFELTRFIKIRIVIVGQDPYHGEGQANGLAFSVPNEHPIPPSLRNIFCEIESDIGVKNKNGDLTPWAKQGVLLLNSILTVVPDKPGSHANFGWEIFTNKVIELISYHLNDVVFLLWGNYAHSKEQFIDPQKHFVLKSTHPSPLSAHKGFLGCKHFSQTNEFLVSKGLATIDWRTDV